jgi:hypothetical protein
MPRRTQLHSAAGRPRDHSGGSSSDRGHSQGSPGSTRCVTIAVRQQGSVPVAQDLRFVHHRPQADRILTSVIVYISISCRRRSHGRTRIPGSSHSCDCENLRSAPGHRVGRVLTGRKSSQMCTLDQQFREHHRFDFVSRPAVEVSSRISFHCPSMTYRPPLRSRRFRCLRFHHLL